MSKINTAITFIRQPDITKICHITRQSYKVNRKYASFFYQTCWNPLNAKPRQSHQIGLTRQVYCMDKISFGNLSGLLYSSQIYTTSKIKGDIIVDIFSWSDLYV